MAIRTLLLFVATIPFTNIASALVIDDFSDGDLSMTVFSLSSETTVQSGLNPDSVIGGVRRTYAGTLANATLDIDSNKGVFDFRAVTSFGYFNLAYGTETPLQIDLQNGANAFELDFTHVTPGLFRGLYNMRVVSSSGTSVRSFAQELFALNGPGVVRIPFADFPNVDFKDVLEISVDAGRVEPGYEISLGSIRTVPEPVTVYMAVPLMVVCFLTGRNTQYNHRMHASGGSRVVAMDRRWPPPRDP